MKTAIIYGSTYGTGRKAAKLLASKLRGEAVTIPINKAKTTCLLKYDFIVIGGTIQRGRIQSNIKQFTSRNFKTLMGINFGLFICSTVDDETDKDMNNSYSKELVKSAYITSNFGGELIPDQGNIVVRKMTRNRILSYKKRGMPLPKLKIEVIEEFANKINNLKIN